MTNIEKVKRILDAGHWVKVTYPDCGYINTVTSYHNNEFSYTDKNPQTIYTVRNPSFQDCTIEVIQRIPTPYVAGDKVLVLSNPSPSNKTMEDMVWKVCDIQCSYDYGYSVWYEDTIFYFPSVFIAPVFKEEISNRDLILSGKEAKIVIDGKEYSVTLKLI